MEHLQYVIYNPTDKTTCQYCEVFREQPNEVISGQTNDVGWWCDGCVNKGRRRTQAQIDWMLFAEDYPQFALELKRLRKLEIGK